MNKRLLRVARYLGSQGLYKEASQIKKLAQGKEDDLDLLSGEDTLAGPGTHPLDLFERPTYPKPRMSGLLMNLIKENGDKKSEILAMYEMLREDGGRTEAEMVDFIEESLPSIRIGQFDESEEDDY